MDWKQGRDEGTASHCTLESKNSVGGSQSHHSHETITPEGIHRDLGQGTGFPFPHAMEYEPSGQSYLDPSCNGTTLGKLKALQNISMRYFYKIICNHNMRESMWGVWKHKTRKRQRQHQNPDIKGLSVVVSYFILLFPTAVCNGRHRVIASEASLKTLMMKPGVWKMGSLKSSQCHTCLKSCFLTHIGSTPSCPMHFVKLAGQSFLFYNVLHFS